jgi:CheY-like chemotaxis protein
VRAHAIDPAAVARRLPRKRPLTNNLSARFDRATPMAAGLHSSRASKAMVAHGHICLVGIPLCRNWQLVQRLTGRRGLTLLHAVNPDDMRVLAVADTVAIDCSLGGAEGSRTLLESVRRTTDATIVILDGGLEAVDVAQLLSAGARDYFPEPLNVAVVAERLEHLADVRRSQRQRLERA